MNTAHSEATTGMSVEHYSTSVTHVQPQVSKTDEVVWSTALLDCFEDASTCCYGFWCCPCLSCTVSGRLQEPYCLPLCDIGSCFTCISAKVPLCVPPAAFGLRLAMRSKYKLKGSLLNDLIVSCCCPWCSWCQIHRELKHQTKLPNVVNVQNVINVQPPPMMPLTKAPESATVNTPLMYK